MCSFQQARISLASKTSQLVDQRLGRPYMSISLVSAYRDPLQPGMAAINYSTTQPLQTLQTQDTILFQVDRSSEWRTSWTRNLPKQSMALEY